MIRIWNARFVTGLTLLLCIGAGCVRMEPTPRPPTPTPPSEYVTAREAYARALPTILQWEQAFSIGAITAPSFDPPAWRPRQDGTAAVWIFDVYGPTRWTLFIYSDGVVYEQACSDDPSRYKCDYAPVGFRERPDSQSMLPMAQIIDSDAAVAIARQSGVPDSVRVNGISTDGYASPNRYKHRLTWVIEFDVPGGIDRFVYIDLLTGEVTHSDFAPATPALAPTTEVGP